MRSATLSFEIILCCLLAAACSRSGSGSITSEPFTQRAVSVPTIYTAQLTPLNKNYVAGGVQVGEATVMVENDDINIKLTGVALGPDMIHYAHIHKGDHCPDTLKDDANHDGVLDIVEGLPSYGFILVNFGANISSLVESLKGGEPTTDDKGVLSYSGSGSYGSMMTDLHDRPEMDPTTGIGKLGKGENFKFEDSVVVVMGIPENTALPDTTMGLRNMSPQSTLPILCGRLQITVRPAPMIDE